MAWLKLVIGAVLEVCWAVGLGHGHAAIHWLATVACIAASFYLLIGACRKIPVGTAYAVFVGLGATGTTLTDFLFFHEPVKITKIILVLLLLAGVVGLKLVTTVKEGS